MLMGIGWWWDWPLLDEYRASWILGDGPGAAAAKDFVRLYNPRRRARRVWLRSMTTTSPLWKCVPLGTVL